MPDTPDFSFEATAIARGYLRVVGVDEVGRGPLCGPVLAAAVRLDPNHIPNGLNDSKKLSAAKRAALFELIIVNAEVAIGEASVAEIDHLNILRASHLAMSRAVGGLAVVPDHVLIDGNMIPRNFVPSAEALVKGDARSLSIAAASIVAKVLRDRTMVDLAQQFPGYGWDRNAGYPTKEHLAALQNLGVTPHHRRSFKPVHNILCQAKTVSH
ncbi:MAG: ribonuclease HII [Albidovulum sp.]